MVTSPRGDRVYVAGVAFDADSVPNRYIVATNPKTGAVLWTAHGASPLPNWAAALAISPDGKSLYVTGWIATRVSLTRNPFFYFYTEARAASNGRLLWSARYLGVGGEVNESTQVAVSPHGDTVYVAGRIEPQGSFQRPPLAVAVVAYSARNGRLKWSSFYPGDGGQNEARGLVVGPRGDKIYLAAQVDRSTTFPSIPLDFAALALRASNGAQLWVRRYRTVNKSAASCCSAQPFAAALDPSGRTFVVTGASQDSAGRWAATTVGYSTGTGKQAWAARYLPAGATKAAGFAVSAANGKFFVTGVSQGIGAATTVEQPVTDAMTLAYSSSGKALWAAQYQPQGSATAAAGAVTVSPNGKRVYIAAYFSPAPSPADVVATYNATVAYDAASGQQAWVARYDVRDPAGGDFWPMGQHGVVANPNGGSVTVIVVRESSIAVASHECVSNANTDVASCQAETLVLGYPS